MGGIVERYRVARRELRDAIRAAKKASWEELIQDLDADPWGRPYKIVSNKL